MRERMGFKQITSLQEAKARGIRALAVFTCATGILTFGCVLYDSWEEGPVKAMGFAVLMTIIVVALLGGAFAISLPGAKRYLEESWANREPKEAPNNTSEHIP